MTDAERLLWRHLRGRHFERWKFRRQHQLSRYVVDFVCLAAGVIVELDGGQHLEDATNDDRRTAALEGLGFRVIRFWNDDVLVNTDAVLEEILEALKQVPPHPNPLPVGEREKSASATDASRGGARVPGGEREKIASADDEASQDEVKVGSCRRGVPCTP